MFLGEQCQFPEGLRNENNSLRGTLLPLSNSGRPPLREDCSLCGVLNLFDSGLEDTTVPGSLLPRRPGMDIQNFTGKDFSEKDLPLLRDLVRECQRWHVGGRLGTWRDFLSVRLKGLEVRRVAGDSKNVCLEVVAQKILSALEHTYRDKDFASIYSSLLAMASRL